MFLLLKAKEIGISSEHSIFLYLLFNLVYALSAFPIGKIADKFGALNMLKIGLTIYMLSYFIFAISNTYWHLILGFCLYGLFYACTNGIIKSLIIERVLKTEKAKAIGLYEGLTSFGLLLSNTLAGFIWFAANSQTVFIYTALISFIITLYFMIYSKKFQTN